MAKVNNPATNILGPGISETQVAEAITKSGYPLQTRIAEQLRTMFSGEERFSRVQEEWAYIDKDTGELRAIDILAETSLYGVHVFEQRQQPRVRPTLDLLIECKQSALPYVFFLAPEKPGVPNFPVFAGLRKDTVTLKTDDDTSSWIFSIQTALNLDSHPFIAENDERKLDVSRGAHNNCRGRRHWGVASRNAAGPW